MGFLARLLGLTRPTPVTRPLDFAYVLELVCRANDASAGWAVGLGDGDVEVGSPAPAVETRQRGAALVQLASADGRTHVTREDAGTFVAVGDFPYAAGVLLATHDADSGAVEPAIHDLRRLVAGMRLAEQDADAGRVAKQVTVALSGAQTLEGVARAAAELAQHLSRRSAAVLLVEGGAEVRVVAVSGTADRRLNGLVLDAAAPAARAIEQRLPLVTQSGEDVFGPGSPQRRRHERGGSAYPLVDGRSAVGALVLVGAPLESDAPALEGIQRLAAELGPRLAAAKAVHEAEQRAVRDPLTGLWNRREFERALDQYRVGPGKAPTAATLIYVDLDHFKRLNDTLGHAAGDAALRHVAGLLEAAVREGDIVARIGGEEFAVWLPHTPLAEGMEVADRIRESVAGSTWMWRSSPYVLTASCGVAACPEPIGDVTNLPAAADAALYRAKQAGRNRVEMAGRGH